MAAHCAEPEPGVVSSTPKALRPTSGGVGGYSQPEAQPYETDEVIVHYVKGGPDAPDEADADADGVPDYVQQVAAAADGALAFYRSPSFRAVPVAAFPVPYCDLIGGPKLDIYIEDIAGFGKAYEPVNGEGGSFVVIDPELHDVKLTGGVAFTTAHEIFHLVQFRSVPAGMPAWVAEGTANLFAFLWSGTENETLVVEIDRWLAAPATPLSSVNLSGCERCYGGVYWWWLTLANGSTVLPRYFELLGAQARRGEPLGAGLPALAQAFSQRYEQIGLGALADDALFHDFMVMAEGTYFVLAPKRPPLLHAVRPTSTPRRMTRTISPLSAHYVKLQLPSSTRSLRLRVRGRGGATPLMRVFHDIDGRRCATSFSPPFLKRGARVVYGRDLVLPIQASRERGPSVLMLTSASLSVVRYTLDYDASDKRRRALGLKWECGISP